MSNDEGNMKTKTVVIYHRADFDGIFCREIAKKFLPEAELIGWDYGDPLIPFPQEGSVYVLDLSPVACSKVTRSPWNFPILNLRPLRPFAGNLFPNRFPVHQTPNKTHNEETHYPDLNRHGAVRSGRGDE
jgi:hypothetical protein